MAKYKDAIFWIAHNDDTRWIENDDPISVTAAMTADLFKKADEEVREDLKIAIQRRDKQKKHQTQPSKLNQ